MRLAKKGGFGRGARQLRCVKNQIRPAALVCPYSECVWSAGSSRSVVLRSNLEHCFEELSVCDPMRVWDRV